MQDKARGEPATFDRSTGKGHPLPSSEEARHGEIPEHLEREKGLGDDLAEAIQPAAEPVNPDGEPYAGGNSGPGEDQAGVPDGLPDGHPDGDGESADGQARTS